MHPAIQTKFGQLKNDKPDGWDIGEELLGSDMEGDKSYNLEVFYFKHFSNGSIYYNSHVGAFSVHGLIKAKYDALNGLNSFLLPGNDETLSGSGKGRFNDFLDLEQIGNHQIFGYVTTTIIWKGGTNEAFALAGQMLRTWESQNKDNGILGFPTSDQIYIPESEFIFTQFEHGVICLTSKGNVSTKYATNVLIADNFIGITNATSDRANVRLYFPSSNCSPDSLRINDINNVDSCFPLLTAITLLEVPAKTTVFWQLPAGHQSIVATFNGNIPVSGRPLETFSNIKTITSRGHHVFSVSSQITINNQTTKLDREIKFYKSTDTSFITPLPNGIQTLNKQLTWKIPEDVDAVNIVIDGMRMNGPFRRGSIINFNLPTSQTAIFVDNNSGKKVTVRLYDAGDGVRWAARQPEVILKAGEKQQKIELMPIAKEVQVTFDGKGLMKLAAGATAIIS